MPHCQWAFLVGANQRDSSRGTCCGIPCAPQGFPGGPPPRGPPVPPAPQQSSCWVRGQEGVTCHPRLLPSSEKEGWARRPQGSGLLRETVSSCISSVAGPLPSPGHGPCPQSAVCPLPRHGVRAGTVRAGGRLRTPGTAGTQTDCAEQPDPDPAAPCAPAGRSPARNSSFCQADRVLAPQTELNLSLMASVTQGVGGLGPWALGSSARWSRRCSPAGSVPDASAGCSSGRHPTLTPVPVQDSASCLSTCAGPGM